MKNNIIYLIMFLFFIIFPAKSSLNAFDFFGYDEISWGSQSFASLTNYQQKMDSY